MDLVPISHSFVIAIEEEEEEEEEEAITGLIVRAVTVQFITINIQA